MAAECYMVGRKDGHDLICRTHGFKWGECGNKFAAENAALRKMVEELEKERMCLSDWSGLLEMRWDQAIELLRKIAHRGPGFKSSAGCAVAANAFLRDYGNTNERAALSKPEAK